MTQGNSIYGKAAIESLARRFPQLYVKPAEGMEATHRLAAVRGIAPADASLDHFCGSEHDELREVQTPAGTVEALFLERRDDFETFLQVVGHRSAPVTIPRTIGAITYRGLADWGKVVAARSAYLANGGDDWSAEFSRLARTPGAFRTELVVVSEGPYSNVPASKTPYDEEEWVRVSREVRLNHECAHVVCRRVMPEDVLPVWDEVTADVVGLLCACGSYDAALAARCLGVTEEGFADGRLIEYLDEGQKNVIDEVSCDVYAAIRRIAQMTESDDVASDPFAFLLELKREPLVAY